MEKEDKLLLEKKKRIWIMLKIFMSSHGKMASGIESTLSILIGDTSKLTVFDAYLDDRNVSEVLQQFFETVEADDEILLCSDLYGGSVNTAMCQFLDRNNTRLVAGVNLAFVLQCMMEDSLSEERIEEIIAEARSGLQLVKIEKTEDNSSDDDFF